MFKRFWWVFLVMLPVGAMAGFLVAAVVTYVMPKKYESETIIEVRPVAAEKASLQNDLEISRSGDDRETPVYMRTAAEEIKSSALLGKAVEKLELINKWGVNRETAIRILKESVNTQIFRSSDLMSIRVRHTDREAARDIAAEMARAYKEYRKEIAEHESDLRLKALNREIGNLEDLAAEYQKIFTVWSKAKWAQGIETRSPDEPIEDDRVDDGVTERFTAREMVDIYWETRNKEADNQSLLTQVKKWRIEETKSDKLWHETIIIHEEPQVPQVPVSPKVTLNLILGAVGGFLLSPLLALPVILLLNRLNPVRVDSSPVLP